MRFTSLQFMCLSFSYVLSFSHFILCTFLFWVCYGDAGRIVKRGLKERGDLEIVRSESVRRLGFLKEPLSIYVWLA